MKAILNCAIGAIALASFFVVESKAQAQSADPDRVELRVAFENNGYEDVIVDGCRVSFTLYFRSPDTIGPYSIAERHLDLDSFKDFSAAEIKSGEINGTSFHKVTIEFDQIYEQSLDRYWSFRLWVRENYPGTSWPTVPHGTVDSDYFPIQEQISRRVSNFEQLNYERLHRAEGVFDFVLTNRVSITSLNLNSLLELKSQISTYADLKSCDVDQ